MSSQTNPKTVELYGHGIQREATANTAITPGMLVERHDGGIRAHATGGGFASPSFTMPFGMTGGGIDTAYEIGDQAVFKTMANGSGVYAMIGAGADVAADAMLASAGDGTLKVAAAGDATVAQALESVNNTGGTDPARIRVEIVPAFTTPA